MKKRIIVNIYTRIVIGGIVLFSLALLACPELPSDGGDTRTKKDSTPPSPYSFSLAKVLYAVVQSKKVPAYTEVNDDKSKAAGIIFRGLGAKKGDTLSVIHVDDKGDDANDGSTWTKAKLTIKSALGTITSNADASANKLYLVLIGSGDYEITETLNMQNYVAIIGGFDASSDEESGYESNTATVISGGGSVQVFENKDLDTETQKSTAVLAGVTITKGKSTSNGGGMYNEKSSPTITHTTFSENTATDFGGGIYNKDDSSPKITHTTFSENKATQHGGGMYNDDSSPTITHTTFSGNTATDFGGGMYNENSSPTITRTTFSKNTATQKGGGMVNANSSPTISSSIFWGNTDNSGNNSKQIENYDGSIPVVAHSIVQGGYADGTAIINKNPLLGTLKNNGGFVETIAIKTGSPAINKGLYVARTDTTYYYSKNGTNWFTDPKLTTGETSSLPKGTTRYTTDARGSTYKGRPDMGAYEYEGDDSPTEKGSTPPSPYSFSDSLAKVLYDAVKNEKVPADTVVNDDKSKAARIIFRGLGAKAGDTLSVIHVDDTGDDANDGSTWKKAKRTIKAALAGITDASANKLYLVLIGSGTYEITETLTMQNYVAIIGGFDASSDEESGYESNTATVISGRGSKQVFKNKDLDTPTKSTAVLAGVTITKGKSENGGGMYNKKSSPTITHTTFSKNTAENDGGGMYNNNNSSPTITRTTFSKNIAENDGGGMYNNNNSSPTITRTTKFSENTAENDGGGMYNDDSSPKVTRTTFSKNIAKNDGGGMYNDESSPTIKNTTKFSENTAKKGGGMYNHESSPKITDTTFSGNTATEDGGGMYNDESSPTIKNTTKFSENTAKKGGGMYNENSSSLLTITDTTFSGNTVTEDGGGMYNHESSPEITHTTFSENKATRNGGGMYNENSSPKITNTEFDINKARIGGGMSNLDSSPTITDTTFSENTADWGGGMYNENSSPTITDTTFSENKAKWNGGGMYNENSSPTITDTTFSENKAKWNGGGMYNENSSSLLTITDTTFSGNTADWGGGMSNLDSSPTITDTTFSENTADWGGGMSNENSSPTITDTTFSENTAKKGGGMYNKKSSPTITDTTFSENKAKWNGGGMYNENSSSLLTITHTTFSQNTATDSGGGISNYNSSPIISSSIFWGNTKGGRNTSSQIENSDGSIPVVAHSIVQGGYADGTAIINKNPLLGTLTNNGGFVETIAIKTGSPAINKGLYVARTDTTYYYSKNGTNWFTDPKLTTGETSNLPKGTTRYTTDARGYTYKGRPDIGAYEYEDDDSPTEKGITPPSPYSFSDSLAKVLYDAVKNEKVPADTVVNDDKSKAARIIFRGLGAKKGDTLSVIHVDDKGDDANDGSAWTKAKRTIKDALAGITDASATKLYLVLIGEGTYTPKAPLEMKNYVAIIGGFDASSNEKSGYERSKATVISGGGSVQVFNNTDLDTPTQKSTAVLAGVTITKGKSTDGGGMYNEQSSPTITHTTFSENKATQHGGGMYNYDSSPKITHTKFSKNIAGYGGGMYNHESSPKITDTKLSKNTATEDGGGMYNDESSPTIKNTTKFSENTAKKGGGMYNENSSSLLTITDTTFSGNTVTEDGGGMYNENSSPKITNTEFDINKARIGGGMYNLDSSPTITHTKFSENTADWGGGMYNKNSSPTITDTTFSENKAKWNGGGMYNENSSPKITDTTFSKNTADWGGGMYNENSSSLLTITDTTFSGNTVTEDGGGMYNENSSPKITNTEFDINKARIGGGMSNENSSPTITDTTFSENTAKKGGGMSNKKSSPTITDTTFSENTAKKGGGMSNKKSSPTITDTTFSENKATLNGGGMYNENSSSLLTITHTTFSQNTATDSGGGISNYNSSPIISSSIFWGNTKGGRNTSSQIENSDGSIPVVAHSIVQGGYADGTAIIDQDPLLKKLTNNGGFVETIAIKTGSPAINKGLYVARTDTTYYYSKNGTNWFTDPKLTTGETSSLPKGTTRYTTDARGYTYKGRPDIGAYEYEDDDSPTEKGITPPSPYSFSDSLAKVLYDAVKNEKVPADTVVNDDKSKAARIIFRGLGATAGDTLSVIHVDDKGDDANDGSTWTKAKLTIKDALAGITDASTTKLYLVLIGSGNYGITETLNMQNYVAIIGGFDASSDEKSGYERSKATVISGGGSVQVFNNTDLDTPTQKSTAVLAGVTITKGKSTSDGGGMRNKNSSPTITHTTFSGNKAKNGGGGMYNKNSSPTITHTKFSKNTATNFGGGMYNASLSPTIMYTIFSKNTADYGGGTYNENSSPTITHTTFSKNTAIQNGGGMVNLDSSPTVSSSIFWGNTDDSGNNSKQIVDDAQSKPVVAHSIVQGGYADGTAIINKNPLLGTLKNNGGFVETIAIKTGSPAINKGLYVARKGRTYYYSKNGTNWFTSPTLSAATKEANFPADATRYTTDARGYTYNGHPDMGAYEYEGTAP